MYYLPSVALIVLILCDIQNVNLQNQCIFTFLKHEIIMAKQAKHSKSFWYKKVDLPSFNCSSCFRKSLIFSWYILIKKAKLHKHQVLTKIRGQSFKKTCWLLIVSPKWKPIAVFTYSWLQNFHICCTIFLLHEVLQYMHFKPFFKTNIVAANHGGWFNLNEALIRMERDNTQAAH